MLFFLNSKNLNLVVLHSLDKSFKIANLLITALKCAKSDIILEPIFTVRIFGTMPKAKLFEAGLFKRRSYARQQDKFPKKLQVLPENFLKHFGLGEKFLLIKNYRNLTSAILKCLLFATFKTKLAYYACHTIKK